MRLISEQFAYACNAVWNFDPLGPIVLFIVSMAIFILGGETPSKITRERLKREAMINLGLGPKAKR